jgi:phospholipid/cholesterol/gamma-HCH transport system substrate-binding protein
VPFRVISGSASGPRRRQRQLPASGRRGGVAEVDHPRRVVALAMIDGNTPVKSDTQVGLEFQGLTGIAAISFTGGSDEAAAPPKGADGIPELTADADGMLNTQEKIRAALRNVDRIIADNEVAVKDTLRNFETFTARSPAMARITSIIATAVRHQRRRRRTDQDQGFLGGLAKRQMWRRVAADRDFAARTDRKFRQEVRR